MIKLGDYHSPRLLRFGYCIENNERGEREKAEN
jgi:hypothetical protein